MKSIDSEDGDLPDTPLLTSSAEVVTGSWTRALILSTKASAAAFCALLCKEKKVPILVITGAAGEMETVALLSSSCKALVPFHGDTASAVCSVKRYYSHALAIGFFFL